MKKSTNIFFGFIALMIICLWLLNYALLKNSADRGTIGDMFGAVNSLFSGLALAGIIYSIFQQSHELSLQRDELTQTRNEFKAQNETMKFQRFENTFFSLLSLHHQIVDSMDLSKKEQKAGKKFAPAEFETLTIRGRDVFLERYDDLEKAISGMTQDGDYDTVYLGQYNQVQTDLGHYFRNLYRIIKLTDATHFGGDENDDVFQIKYNYVCIVRAQL